MHDPIKYLVKQGFETVCVSFCVDLLKSLTTTWKDPNLFISEIVNVVGEDCAAFVDKQLLSSLSFFQVRYTYFYVVQNLLLANKRKEVIDFKKILDQSLNQSMSFCKEHHTALQDEGREMGVIVDSKTRKGTKTEQALDIFVNVIGDGDVDSDDYRTQIIQRFQDELDMARSGALTYYHATKKRYLTR